MAANKVLNLIREGHNGTLNDSRYGQRMRGDGKFAEQIQAQFKLAVKKYMSDGARPIMNVTAFRREFSSQTKLF